MRLPHCIIFVICLGVAACFNTAVMAGTVRIGMVHDGTVPDAEHLTDMVQSEIVNITQGAHDVDFPARFNLAGNYDLVQINRALDQLLASDQVDVILVLGAVATHEACRLSSFPKPVICARVIDADTQELPVRKGVSGVENLNYINIFSDFDRAFQAFIAIVPFYRVTVLADGFQMRAIPQLKKLERRLANEFSLDLTVIPVEDRIQPAIDRIPEDTEAVFVSLLPRISQKDILILADRLIQRKLPSFSFRGRPDVEKGILTSILPGDRDIHLARSIAINVQELLDGKGAGSLQTYFPLGEKPSINMGTALSINVYPGWSILTEADLINDKAGEGGRKLNIRQAVGDALEANPDLAAARQTVLAGGYRVDEARASLLPQLELGSGARIIDDDRAAASLGTTAEREWTGSVRARQILYSDKAWANYEIQGYARDAKVQGRQAVELDIVQAAATAYLNVLRTGSIERIQKENLKLTRENLERAQIRVSIGIAGPEEVYRWKSQIAESQRLVLRAESAFLDAAARLNQILNRPLGEKFRVAQSDYEDPLKILPCQPILAYMENPQKLNALKEFLILEGVGAAPELQQIDASIAAQKRRITLSKREFWVPTVSLEGDVTETFEKGGEGSSPSAALAGFNLPANNDTDWSAGVFVSLPLYTGGRRSSVEKRSLKELSELKYRRSALSNAIERQIIHSVHLVRASYPTIRLTVHAADSARRNLMLVTDSYARGIKSIIDLIDAQNNSLVAEQYAANAVYDFLIDLMTVQRSLGRFFLFEPQGDFVTRLASFMGARGFHPGG